MFCFRTTLALLKYEFLISIKLYFIQFSTHLSLHGSESEFLCQIIERKTQIIILLLITN
jgi:hypothetical protein